MRKYTNHAGGAPYRDLVKCFEHVRDNIPYIDTDHAVAAGASYGGYMLNWIQGNALGREFKALVTHDGAFIMDNMYATEELWFPQHEVRASRPSLSFSHSQHADSNSLWEPSGTLGDTTGDSIPRTRGLTPSASPILRTNI